MKKLIIAIVILLPISAQAAECKLARKIMDTWFYDCTVKNGLVSTPLTVIEYDCKTPEDHTGKAMLDKPTKCANTQEEADKEAAKEAAKFEADKTANGESTTVIETKRQLLNAKNSIMNAVH